VFGLGIFCRIDGSIVGIRRIWGFFTQAIPPEPWWWPLAWQLYVSNMFFSANHQEFLKCSALFLPNLESPVVLAVCISSYEVAKPVFSSCGKLHACLLESILAIFCFS